MPEAARHCPAFLLTCLLLVTLFAAADASAAAPQETSPPTEAADSSSQVDASETPSANQSSPGGQAAPTASSETASPEETSSDPAAETDSPPAEKNSWMTSIDEQFGVYVVDNMEWLLFFPIWTVESDEIDAVTGQPTGKKITTSIPFVVVWLFVGAVFLTLRMGFINFRGFKHAIDLTRGAYDTPGEPGEVSHFQALSAALSATVGLGNIAGVAIAIGTGGPGATFWIIMVGLLGMTAKFAECTLGQLYRVSDEDGRILGGPMRYLKTGLKELGLAPLGTVLSGAFMLLCIGASFGGGNAFQVGQSLEAIRADVPLLQDYPFVYGLVMATLVGVVIIGGIKSIGAVAGRIVPFMCLAYVLAALYILAMNASQIPSAFGMIVTQAFAPDAVAGGILGVLVIGIQRAVFSNEAGIGSAAIAHSAAKTDEPVSEGIVALLEPFIDTVLVCTITALVVIVTGAYNAPELSEAIANDQGAKVTLFAFITGGEDWFRYVLYMAVVLFAYSTCISWSYYGERCWVELFGARTSIVYKVLFLIFTVLGSIITQGKILAFSDLMLLSMSFPNLLGVFLLSGMVKQQLDMYWQKYTRGELAQAKDA
ncbi:MAG: amino acid carrier protein [Pirellulales bacterium]|nr:amino acid carrier protein [Pirellulales bacterium]